MANAVIVTLPTFLPVTLPFLSTVAIFVLLDVHFNLGVVALLDLTVAFRV